jgi:hypothetical protein
MGKGKEIREERRLWHKRIVLHNGIWFNGIIYSSPELMAIGHRADERLIVEVCPAPLNVRTIVVRIPGEEIVLRVPALTPLYPPKRGELKVGARGMAILASRGAAV